MHGAKRDGRHYLEAWLRHTEKSRIVVVVPEFSSRRYPGSRSYNIGGVVSASGGLLPRSHWTFSAIEFIFDWLVKRANSRATGYSMYGHSAGGQFVQRALLLGSLVRVDRAVAANAGWYTLPTTSHTFPYGLKGVGGESMQSDAFRRDFRILVGDQDIVSDRKLRETPEAMQQGRNRLERGKHVYAAAMEEARRIGEEFRWSFGTVPGAGHDNGRIMSVAAEWLFPSR